MKYQVVIKDHAQQQQRKHTFVSNENLKNFITSLSATLAGRELRPNFVGLNPQSIQRLINSPDTQSQNWKRLSIAKADT